MKKIAFISCILLVGCAKPVPVKMDFPLAPASILKKCEELKQIEPRAGGVPITELLKTVVENYTLYHECANKVEGWSEWYESMKKIYGEVKK